MGRNQCAFCGTPFGDEYGHRAEPFASGRACNRCNARIIIPAKIKLQREVDDQVTRSPIDGGELQQ